RTALDRCEARLRGGRCVVACSVSAHTHDIVRLCRRRVPLVFATGAGANSRKSIGIAVASVMLASTCLAVLFVPSFFVVVRRFEEWRAARKVKPAAKPAPAE